MASANSELMLQGISLLIKPASADCNLACRYCFYAPKQQLYPGKNRMSLDLLEKVISQYMGVAGPVATLCWQGGEPTLMGLDFYKKAVELEKRYERADQQVNNAFQTNGILLDDNWARFFADNSFLVGISIDGRARLHDQYRKDHAGNATHDRVLKSVRLLQRYNVDFNVLTVVNDINVKKPEALFNYFLDLGITYMQFIPCLELETDGRAAPFSVSPEDYGEFLCRLFDKWYNMGQPACYIRDFDELLIYYVTGRHPSCTCSPLCNSTVVIEHNGDIYPCDFFVEPQWLLGNVNEKPLVELLLSDKYKAFRNGKQELADECRRCKYLPLCWGGCRKFRWDGYGNPIQRSYYCDAYKRFYEYSQKRFEHLASHWKEG